MISREQREERRGFVGASDVPALLGLDPYGRTATDVYWDKVADRPDVDTPSTTVGNLMEAVLVQYAAERLGITVKANVRLLHEGGILAANLDALDEESGEGIEAKVSSKDSGEWGAEGTDEVPMRVLVQAQAQIACGASRIWVPVLIVDFAPRFALYRVEPHAEVIAQILSRVTGFWRDHVIPQIPPDGIEAPPIDVLRSMGRDRVCIRLDESALPFLEAFELAAVARREAERIEELAKRELIALLATADEALLPDGRRMTYFAQPSTPSVDHMLLRAKFSEAAAECVKQGTHRRLLVRKR